MIQNAMDAVDKKSEAQEKTSYRKKLWITINLDDNSLLITDNGIGFDNDQIRHFLAPNISYKSDGKTRGNKGVGATYLAYGFNYLSFHTKKSGIINTGAIENGRNWVEDDQGTVHRPLIKSLDTTASILDSFDSGTTFRLVVGGEHSRPKNLGWIKADTALQWKYLLLAKTPLGMIETNEENTIFFDLKIIKNNNEDILIDQKAIYIYPNVEITGSLQYRQIIQTQKEAVNKGTDVERALSKFQKKNGLFDFFNTEELIEMNDDAEVKEIIRNHSVSAYGYFGYSTSVWDVLGSGLL